MIAFIKTKIDLQTISLDILTFFNISLYQSINSCHIYIIHYTYPGGADPVSIYGTLSYYCFWAANLQALFSMLIGLGKTSPELDYSGRSEALSPCSASIYIVFKERLPF